MYNPRFSDIDIIDLDQGHMLGRVHSLESSSAVDGPGLRFVIFLQGCQFQCKYCHNRDSWAMQSGELYAVSELVERVLPYAPFLDASAGGVTVSGGEAVLQPEFIAMLFRKLKVLGLHTCLDTNGNVAAGVYGELLDIILHNVDLVLLDIKHMDLHKHRALVGASNENTLKFARYLAQIGHPTWIRYVVVPGFTDDFDDIRALAEFIAPMPQVQRVELLPYHKMGTGKWRDMHLAYPLEGVEPPSEALMAAIETMLKEEFNMQVVR